MQKLSVVFLVTAALRHILIAFSSDSLQGSNWTIEMSLEHHIVLTFLFFPSSPSRMFYSLLIPRFLSPEIA